VFVLEYCPGG
jgi:serine/threonine protein kinase